MFELSLYMFARNQAFKASPSADGGDELGTHASLATVSKQSRIALLGLF